MIVLDTTIVNVALPVDPARPALQPGEPHLGRQRLPRHVRQLPAARRPARRPVRPQARVPRRRGRLHRRLGRSAGWRPTRAALIGARFIQGIGAAMQASVILAIIATEFPQPGDRARAMSAYVFVAVAGGSLGLLAGGALTQALSWHWIFFVNLPIGAMTLALGRALIPADERVGAAGRVDWLGSLLVTASLMSAIYAIVQASGHGWGSSAVLGFGALAAALMAAFLALETRIENPIMPLRILRVRGLIGSSAVRGFLVTGMYSTFFLGTLYLEHVLALRRAADRPRVPALDADRRRAVARHHRPAGRALRRDARADRRDAHRDRRPRLAHDRGPATRASSRRSSSPTSRSASGSAAAFMPLLTIAMADVPAADAGLGSGIVNVSQQVSGALGLAVLGTIATNRTHALEAAHHPLVGSLLGGYHLAFVIGAASVARRDPRRAHPAADAPAARARPRLVEHGLPPPTSSRPNSSGKPPDPRRPKPHTRTPTQSPSPARSLMSSLTTNPADSAQRAQMRRRSGRLDLHPRDRRDAAHAQACPHPWRVRRVAQRNRPLAAGRAPAHSGARAAAPSGAAARGLGNTVDFCGPPSAFRLLSPELGDLGDGPRGSARPAIELVVRPCCGWLLPARERFAVLLRPPLLPARSCLATRV